MSRLISDILQPKQPDFQQTLLEWERRVGKEAHDVRLVSDIRVRAKNAVTGLGLDHKDTAPAELYFALQGKARDDNAWLSDYFKVDAEDTPTQLLKKIVNWLEADHLPKAWVCKTSVMKVTLKKCPPKTVMKTLGLRSVDSMLKRGNPSEILPLAYLLESQQWKTKLRSEFKKYKPTDFDERKISVIMPSDAKVQKLTKAGMHQSRIVTPCYEMGSLVLVAPKQRFNLDVLAITLVLLEAVAEIRRHSAYSRTLSVRKDFGKQFYEVSTNGIVHASEKLSHIGWNSLHRHLVGNDVLFERLEQPHLSSGDIHAPSATKVLSGLDPRFEYWNDLDFVFFHKPASRPVSMHLIDVVTNASNRLPYAESVTTYGRARLWDELWSRYLANDKIADLVVGQFLADEDWNV